MIPRQGNVDMVKYVPCARRVYQYIASELRRITNHLREPDVTYLISQSGKDGSNPDHPTKRCSPHPTTLPHAITPPPLFFDHPVVVVGTGMINLLPPSDGGKQSSVIYAVQMR